MTDKKFWRGEKAAWMLIGALMVSTIVFAFVQYDQYEWHLFVVIGLTCSFSGVLAIWIIFGRQRLPTRIVTFLLAMPAVWIAVVALFQDNTYAIVTGFFMLFQAVSCVTLFGLLHLASWQIGRASDVESGDSHDVNRFQFSIRWQLALTGAIAVLLASGRAVGVHAYAVAVRNEFQSGYIDIGNIFFMIGMIVLPMVFSTVSIFWATRTALRIARRLVMAIVLSQLFVTAVFAGLDWYGEYVGGYLHDYMLMYSIHFSATAAGLSILRRAGWLRVSRQRNTEVTP